MSDKEKFYQKTWFMWLTLIFFAPVGIFLIWKNKKFSKIPRAALTIIFAFIFLIEVAVAGTDPSEPANTLPPAQVAGTEQTEQTEPAQSDQSEPAAREDQKAPVDVSRSIESTPEDNNTDPAPTPAAIPASSPVSGTLKVHFIDVGQADSILIQAPSGKSMLIDAGNNGDGQMVVDYINNQGISKLDVVVGTHPHEDHLGGLDTVINSLSIGQVVMPAKTHTTETYKDVLTAVQNKGLKITTAKPGVSLDLGSGITANVIAPIGSSYDGLNSYSAVIRLAFGSTSFLFTGDAEADSEAEMIAAGSNLSATVLKVGHHGSTTSSSQSFLNKVQPAYAVIMVGADNNYGHPEQETLTKLANIGAKVFRTDLNGTIIATSDGSAVTFNTAPTTVTPSTPAPAPTPPPASTQPAPDPDQNNPNAVIVYKADTGTKYHRDNCRYVVDSKTPMTLEEAKAAGLEPCGVCKPPQ